MSALVPIHWVFRAEPLVPSAVVASGEAARRLVSKLLATADDALAKLSGVASAEVVVLLGAADDLPWVDGVSYLGIDEEAPALRLPTHSAPSVPAALLERAVLAKVMGPVAVLPSKLVPLGAARPLSKRALQAFLA